jgi:hypothetical protein
MTLETFSMQEQTAFAALTGDWNPLHVDPVAARRTQFGRPLVHGVHLLLRALETAFDLERPASIATLHCSFRRSLGVGELAEYSASWQNGLLQLHVTSQRAVCLAAEIGFTPYVSLSFVDAALAQGSCKAIVPKDGVTGCGTTPLQISGSDLVAAFPRLAIMLPAGQLAFLAATTRIVGMECPGLHSIYMALDIAPPVVGASPGVVDWRVEDYDERFKRLTIAASSEAGYATITAAMRPAPQAQPDTDKIRRSVPTDAYAERRALVIGGSRGLGELCAKMLGAGHAQVRLTYHLGSGDAERVVREIRMAGGSAEAFAFDALSPPDNLEQLLGSGWVPTHIYYFATPPIIAGIVGHFSPPLFQSFCHFYVNGVQALWASIRGFSKQALTLIYPSSVYVDAMVSNLGEYAVAKAAGESLCRFIESVDRHTHVKIVRLPRLPTDQTLSLTDDEPADDDPVTVMAALLEHGEPSSRTTSRCATRS